MPAGYRQYAASPADFVASGQVGSPLVIASAVLSVWTAQAGGSRVTDLLDASETPVLQVQTDLFGNFRYYAPDTLGSLWVSADDGVTRYVTHPADLADQVVGVGEARQAAVAAAAQARAAVEQVAAYIAGGGGGSGTGGGGPAVRAVESETDAPAAAAAAPDGTIIAIWKRGTP